MMLEWVEFIVAAVGYLGIVFLMVLESIILPLPSEAILPFAGYLVAIGALNLWWVTVAATIGSLIGSSLAYAVGRHGGRPFLAKYGKYLLFDEERMDGADKYFSKYGGKTVFYARLIPVVRHFISISAGITRMPFKQFLLYTAAGSFIWNLALTSVGLFLGAQWERVSTYTTPIEIVLVIFVICGILWYILAAIEERTRVLRRIRQSETVQRPLRAAKRTAEDIRDRARGKKSR